MKRTGVVAVILTACLIHVVEPATITTQATTHTTKEHSVTANMLFHYVAKTHHMVLKRGANECFVTQLSDSELQNVHMDGGVRAIEIRMIASLFIAVKVDVSTLNISDCRACGRGFHNTTMVYYKL